MDDTYGFEQLQLLEERKLNQNQLDEINYYIGINARIDSPNNIYVRKEDLLENRQILRFVVYTLGKKNALMWGEFDRNPELIDNNMKFRINGSCRMGEKEQPDKTPVRYFYLLSLSNQYINAGYTHADNQEKLNSKAENLELRAEGKGINIGDYQDYLKYKYLLSFKDSVISEEDCMRAGDINPFEEEDRYYEQQELYKQELNLKRQEFYLEHEFELNQMGINIHSIFSEKESMNPAFFQSTLSYNQEHMNWDEWLEWARYSIPIYEQIINLTVVNRTSEIPQEALLALKYLVESFTEFIRKSPLISTSFYQNLEYCPGASEISFESDIL